MKDKKINIDEPILKIDKTFLGKGSPGIENFLK